MGTLLRSATLALALPLGAAGKTGALEVSFLGPPDGPAARGAELGIAEANAQGRYFERTFALRYRESAAELPDGAVVIAAVAADRLRDALGGGRVVLNAASAEDALRDACPPGLFHTAASERMAADAGRQAESAGLGAVRVQTWHPSLVRFAARDLNARYRERFGEAMGPDAWAAWAAARLIGEAAIRGGSGGEGDGAAAIAAFLRDEISFDGQKGTALSFRPNGQLRQPLYLVVEEAVVGEAPLREVVPDRDLDSLGRVGCDPSPPLLD